MLCNRLAGPTCVGSSRHHPTDANWILWLSSIPKQTAPAKQQGQSVLVGKIVKLNTQNTCILDVYLTNASQKVTLVLICHSWMNFMPSFCPSVYLPLKLMMPRSCPWCQLLWRSPGILKGLSRVAETEENNLREISAEHSLQRGQTDGRKAHGGRRIRVSYAQVVWKSRDMLAQTYLTWPRELKVPIHSSDPRASAAELKQTSQTEQTSSSSGPT